MAGCTTTQHAQHTEHRGTCFGHSVPHHTHTHNRQQKRQSSTSHSCMSRADSFIHSFVAKKKKCKTKRNNLSCAGPTRPHRDDNTIPCALAHTAPIQPLNKAKKVPSRQRIRIAQPKFNTNQSGGKPISDCTPKNNEKNQRDRDTLRANSKACLGGLRTLKKKNKRSCRPRKQKKCDLVDHLHIYSRDRHPSSVGSSLFRACSDSGSDDTPRQAPCR